MIQNPETSPGIQEPQRPDLGIETVSPSGLIRIPESTLPWAHEDYEVSTAFITLEDGTTVEYGSAVSANNSLVNIAGKVPPEKSRQAEAGLFKALPSFLNNQNHPNIDTVAMTESDQPVYKVAKRGNDVARLAFIRLENRGTPVIIKVGIARHKDQQRMMGILNGGGQRRKRDGHS